MSDRGMKKWLPFNSLIEQNTYLEKMIYEKRKIKKPQVSTEQASKIDRILKEYADMTLNFKFYLDGYLYYFSGTIVKMDKVKKIIYFKDFFINIKDIIDIDNPDEFGDIC